MFETFFKCSRMLQKDLRISKIFVQSTELSRNFENYKKLFVLGLFCSFSVCNFLHIEIHSRIFSGTFQKIGEIPTTFENTSSLVTIPLISPQLHLISHFRHLHLPCTHTTTKLWCLSELVSRIFLFPKIPYLISKRITV